MKLIRWKANVKLKRETSRGQTVNYSKMLNFETSIAIVGLMYGMKASVWYSEGYYWSTCIEKVPQFIAYTN